MGNSKNLIPQAHKLTVEEQSAGGKASVKARAEKRNLRKALELLLERDYVDKSGNSITGASAISAKLFEKAMKGDVRAFETIRATVGQDPVQKVMIAEVDQDVIDEVERMVLDESTGSDD